MRKIEEAKMFIKLTLPGLAPHLADKPIAINTGTLRDFAPRMVPVRENGPNNPVTGYTEEGTWINVGDGEESRYWVREAYERIANLLGVVE